MLAILRRCPAVALDSLRSTSPRSRLFLTPSTLSRIANKPKAPMRLLHQGRISLQTAAAHATAEETDEPGHSGDKPGPPTTFQQLADQGLVNENVIGAITQDMGLSTMTPVQCMTIGETLKGTDVLAQAKTGTGKTLGFLIPVLQNILRDQPELTSPRARRGASTDSTLALIISPTRELAEQIAVEAKRLTRHMGIVVQTAVGGTSKNYGLRQMQQYGCHLLIGTPGRLKDIFSDPRTRVTAPNLNTLVLDEADRLLDQGFFPEIQAIEELLPHKAEKDRQTLMFSATMPREIISIVRQTMKHDYQFVRTVRDDEAPTHERVPQKLVNVGGFENLLPTLLELCKRESQDSTRSPPFKAIVYFGATAHVRVAASTFENLQGPGGSRFSNPLHPTKIIEIHSRLSQAQRTRAADTFRRAQSAILFSSDVTARGMDFPNVTHVIQIGVPPNREAYIHRLGRTARGDKTGEGWVLATDYEMRETHERLRGLKLGPDRSLQCAGVDMSQASQLPAHVAETLTQVSAASQTVPAEDKQKAYLASLGVYAFVPGQVLVDGLNRLSKYGWSRDAPPGVPSGLAQKLGLARVSGINLESRPRSPSLRGPRTFGGSGMRGRPGGYEGGLSDSRYSRDSRGPRSRGDFGSNQREFKPSWMEDEMRSFSSRAESSGYPRRGRRSY